MSVLGTETTRKREREETAGRDSSLNQDTPSKRRRRNDDNTASTPRNGRTMARAIIQESREETDLEDRISQDKPSSSAGPGIGNVSLVEAHTDEQESIDSMKLRPRRRNFRWTKNGLVPNSPSPEATPESTSRTNGTGAKRSEQAKETAAENTPSKKRGRPRKLVPPVEESGYGSNKTDVAGVDSAALNGSRVNGASFDALNGSGRKAASPLKRQGKRSQPATPSSRAQKKAQKAELERRVAQSEGRTVPTAGVLNRTTDSIAKEHLSRTHLNLDEDAQMAENDTIAIPVKSSKDLFGGPPTTGLNPSISDKSILLPKHSTKSSNKTITRPPVSPATRTSLELLSPFEALKTAVLQKLTQQRPIPLTHLDEEYSKVHQLLHATVMAGESNSMLLIGARGCGKTALVNQAISQLSHDPELGDSPFHVVRLNGFIHTDDKIASREIWRQLGREMEVEHENMGGAGKSYADTLAMLLALLGHNEDGINKTAQNEISNSIIFVIDEFDLFALHPRQTLLYNLLDIAQSRKAPIAVLGLTTRIDVVESLEKRVKSRFSHRYVHVGYPRSMVAFQDVVKAAMRVEPVELNSSERAHICGKAENGDSTEMIETYKDDNLMTEWNTAVDSLIATQSFIETYLSPIFHTTKSIPTVLTSLLTTTTALSSPKDLLPIFTTLNPTSLDLLTAPTSNLSLLPSLSELSLSLLISACRLDILTSTPLTNFQLTYEEYISLASAARLKTSSLSTLSSGVSGIRVWSKDIARGEWERLLEVGLLIPATGVSDVLGGGAGSLSGSAAAKGAAVGGVQMVKADVSLEEVYGELRGTGVLTGAMEKWCKQL